MSLASSWTSGIWNQEEHTLKAYFLFIVAMAIFPSASFGGDLIIPSGGTLSGGKVYGPGESPTAKKLLEKDGYFVSGTVLILRVGDNDYSVDLRELGSKRKSTRTDYVKAEIKAQMLSEQAVQLDQLRAESAGELTAIIEGEYAEIAEELTAIMNEETGLDNMIEESLGDIEQISSAIEAEIGSQLEELTSTIEEGVSEVESVGGEGNVSNLEASCGAEC